MWGRNPSPPPAPARIVTASPLDSGPNSLARLDKHVARFNLAIEQCTNPTRLPELERNLRYYTALREAAYIMAEPV